MGRLNSEVMTVIKTFTIFRIAHSLISRVFGVFRFLLGRAGGEAGKPLLDVRDFQDFAQGGMRIPTTPGNNPQSPPGWRGLLLVFVVTFVGLPMLVNRLFALLSRRSALELEWSKEGRGEQVLALHDFEGESTRELSFHKGDVLTVINKFHPDWWEASYNGHTGIIPASYVSADELDTQPLHDEFKSSAK